MAPRGEKSELKLSGLGAIRSKWGSIRMMVDEGMAKCSGVRAGLSVHTNTHPCRHTLGGRGSSDGPRGASLNHERGLSISAPTQTGVWERRFRCSDRDYAQMLCSGTVVIIVTKHLADNHCASRWTGVCVHAATPTVLVCV